MTLPVSTLKKATRVLFLCWGPSIHARRRIQIFVDDPRFAVAVVSTFDYRFDGAENWPLSVARNQIVQQHGSALSKELDSTAAHKTLLRRLPAWVKQVMKLPFDLAACVKDFNILKTAVREFAPHVIFLQTLLYPSYLSYLLPRRIPIVVTFWNGDLTWWARWNGIERFWKKRIVRHGVKRASAITVNSKTALETCLKLGKDQKNVHLIRYPGANLGHFRPGSKWAAREELRLSATQVVLCPRGFADYLNSDVIVEAAAHVVKKYPDALFLFLSAAGGEKLWREHLQRATALGINRNLRWDGQVPWEKMPRYYASADAMVSISSNDSLPSCMVEAIACGIPVVMGDIPQIREWVEDGVNGFLTSTRDPKALADKIVQVFEGSAELVREFAAKNLERIRLEADAAKCAEEIKTLVQDLRLASQSGRWS